VTTAPNALLGLTVVIVEDQLIVADSLRMLVESFGAVVAGMAPSVEKAIDLVRRLDFDVAILDIDLRGRNVEPVARVLQELEKKFFFVSGYSDVPMLADDLRSIPRLTKPLEPNALVRTIRALAPA